MTKGERTLTTGEAAELCGVSRSTLRRAVARGHLQAWHTPGRHLRFGESACLAFALSLGREEIELVGRRYGAEKLPDTGAVIPNVAPAHA